MHNGRVVVAVPKIGDLIAAVFFEIVLHVRLDVLLDDIDVIVSVTTALLVVEPERVHQLVEYGSVLDASVPQVDHLGPVALLADLGKTALTGAGDDDVVSVLWVFRSEPHTGLLVVGRHS